MEEDYGPAPRNRRGLRTGYTTGSCAAAAAKAATLALVRGERASEVSISLPIGGEATFAPTSWSAGEGWISCAVIKDAGDDPDVTHCAAIVARVEWAGQPGVALAGGEGVGVVTLPGLGLEVGGPAINPVPRKMIVSEVLQVAGAAVEARGLRVTIAVPGGDQLAKKTLNARLGILNGLSILGTWGIVKPYSTASWRASVVQAVQVAVANGQDHLVLATGSRSERYAMRQFPELGELAFVEMGIFTGAALRRCARDGVRRATIAGMVGKFAKLARGHMQTHVAGNQVDLPFLAEVARAAGASETLAGAIAAANTARHAGELVAQAGVAAPFYARLANLARDECFNYAGGKLEVDALLFDFDGNVLARAPALPTSEARA